MLLNRKRIQTVVFPGHLNGNNEIYISASVIELCPRNSQNGYKDIFVGTFPNKEAIAKSGSFTKLI